jgi:hypothetical protein
MLATPTTTITNVRVSAITIDAMASEEGPQAAVEARSNFCGRPKSLVV